MHPMSDTSSSVLLQFTDEHINWSYQEYCKSKFSSFKYFLYVLCAMALFAFTSTMVRTGADENLLIAAIVIDGALSILPAWCATAIMARQYLCSSDSEVMSGLQSSGSSGSVKFLIRSFGTAQLLSWGLLLIGSGSLNGASATVSSVGPLTMVIILMGNQQVLKLEWKHSLFSWLFTLVCTTICTFTDGGWIAVGVTMVVMFILLCVMYDWERTSMDHFLQLRQSREEAVKAQHALDGKKLLTRYVAHEVRSPLNIVHGGLEMVLAEVFALFSGHSQKPSWIDQLMDIFESSGVAINTLSDFLQFENMDEGNFNMEKARVSVSTMVSKCLKPCHIMARKNGLSFIILDEVIEALATSPLQRACIHVDIFRIDQVIRNLVSNAMKFTPRGGSVTVRLSVVEREEQAGREDHEKKHDRESHDVQAIRRAASVFGDAVVDSSGYQSLWRGASSVVAPAPLPVEAPVPSLPPPAMVPTLRIEVIDTGPGIEPENHSKVFGQFTQFNRNELQGGGGSGLGLWISRQMVEMHGGSLGFSSEGLGKGCTFFFELPFHQSDSKSEPDGIINRDAGDANEGENEEDLAEDKEALLACAGMLPHFHRPALPSAQCSSLDEKSSRVFHFSGDGDGSIHQDTLMRRPSLTQQRGDEEEQLGAHIIPPSDKDTASKKPSPNLMGSDHVSISHSPLAGPQPLSLPRSPLPCQSRAQLQRRMRLLVVDDSEMNRKFICRILKHSQYFRDADACEATDGTEAVAAIRASLCEGGDPFDLVFMDSEMMEMHGPQAASVMRSELGYEGVIVGVMGYVSPEDVASFKAAGADEVLPKPLTTARIDQLANQLQTTHHDVV